MEAVQGSSFLSNLNVTSYSCLTNMDNVFGFGDGRSLENNRYNVQRSPENIFTLCEKDNKSPGTRKSFRIPALSPGKWMGQGPLGSDS